MHRFDMNHLGELLDRLSHSLKDTDSLEAKIRNGLDWVHGKPVLLRGRRTLATILFRNDGDPRWRQSSTKTGVDMDEMGPAGLGAVLGFAAGFGTAELLLTVPLVAVEVALAIGILTLGLAGVACAAVGGAVGAAIGSACSLFGREGNRRKGIGTVIGASIPGAPAILLFGIASIAALGVITVASLGKHAISSLIGAPLGLAGAVLGMGWSATSKLSQRPKASRPAMESATTWRVNEASGWNTDSHVSSPSPERHHKTAPPSQEFGRRTLPPPSAPAPSAWNDPLSL